MEEKLAQYRAQKAKEYEGKKKLDNNGIIQKGWQLVNSWRNEPVSMRIDYKLHYRTEATWTQIFQKQETLSYMK